MDYQFPYKELLQEIFGKRDDFLPLRQKDIDTLFEVLKERLTFTECEAITMRFRLGEPERDKHTYQEIGEALNFSSNKARQVCKYAIEKLRRTQNNQELRWFFRDLLEADFAEVREKNKHLQYLESIAEELKAESSQFLNFDTSVDELRLSERTWKILRNANINTVREIAEWPEDKLKGLRNCGTKTINEIKMLLARLGLAPGCLIKKD